MKTSENILSNSIIRKGRPEHIGALFWPILAVLPLVAGVGYAILYSIGAIGLIAEDVTLQYWSETLSDTGLLYSFVYSLYIALVSMLISIGIALGLTLVFRSYAGRRWTGMLLYAPLAIPSVVTAFFVYEMFAQSGWLAGLLVQIGVMGPDTSFPIMIQDPYGIGILMAHVFMAAPFFLILFLNVYQNEQVERLREVAISLGARPVQADLHITIPIVLQRVYPTLVLYFIFAMGSYEIPLLLGSSSPQMIAVTIVRHLQQFSLDTIPQAYILSLIYLVFVMVIIVMLLKRKKLFYDIES